MLQFDVARLIVGASPPLAVDIDSGKVSVWLPARYWRDVVWVGCKSLRDVVPRKKMRSLVPNVVDLERGVLEDLTLHGKGPLLHVRILGSSEMITARNVLCAGVTGEIVLLARKIWSDSFGALATGWVAGVMAARTA